MNHVKENLLYIYMQVIVPAIVSRSYEAMPQKKDRRVSFSQEFTDRLDLIARFFRKMNLSPTEYMALRLQYFIMIKWAVEI